MRNVLLGFLFLISLTAQAETPSCLNFQHDQIQINNEEVIRWKTTTPNSFKDRGFISGKLSEILVERNGHLHFDVNLSPLSGQSDLSDHIEVVYNKQFGVVEHFPVGADIVACGDYITSTAQNGKFPPSPMGAIVHWVHMSPDLDRHPSGFLVVNGRLAGQHNPNDSWGAMLGILEHFSASPNPESTLRNAH